MPFGLKTAGSSFTRAMNLALEGAHLENVIVYLDDVLIASETLVDHLRDVEEVLERLRVAGFKLNRDKCEFMRTEITFLGHKFTQIKAEINEETKATIRAFQVPRNKKALQSFLGLVNWDRRFIENLAQLTRPLERLLCKGIGYQWTAKEQEAFDGIKKAIEDAENLYLIQPGHRFGLYVDASTNGLRARLYQYRQGEEEEFTVAYASRSLKGAEFNYTTTEMECLAVVWALRKWYTLLLGRHVKVHTDHKALRFLETCVQNNPKIARWFAFLQEFELEIEHVAGKQNGQADALSRALNDAQERDDKMRRIALIQDPAEGINTAEWIPIIRRAQDRDDELTSAAEQHPGLIYERDGLYRVLNENGHGDRVALPKTITWRILMKIHQLLVHFGTDKVIAFAEQHFYGFNIAKVARDVVASCKLCIATKHYQRATEGTQYFNLPNAPGMVVSLDIFGPLPKTREGYRYLLVLMDQFSKYTRLYPMDNQILETIVTILQDQYFPEEGLPGAILTDNGGQFRTERWMQFADANEFEVMKTSPYNPQSNPVERVMKEIGRVMRAYSSDRHHAWSRITPRLERILNATVHSSTGFAPDELHKERTIEVGLHPDLLSSQQPDDNRERRFSQARIRLRIAADKRKRQFDKKTAAAPYQVGDKVWGKIHRQSNARKQSTRKLQTIYEGPYQILRVIRPNAYEVADMDGRPIGVYNSRRLRPHREARLKGLDEEEESEDELRVSMIRVGADENTAKERKEEERKPQGPSDDARARKSSRLKPGIRRKRPEPRRRCSSSVGDMLKQSSLGRKWNATLMNKGAETDARRKTSKERIKRM